MKMMGLFFWLTFLCDFWLCCVCCFFVLVLLVFSLPNREKTTTPGLERVDEDDGLALFLCFLYVFVAGWFSMNNAAPMNLKNAAPMAAGCLVPLPITNVLFEMLNLDSICGQIDRQNSIGVHIEFNQGNDV